MHRMQNSLRWMQNYLRSMQKLLIRSYRESKFNIRRRTPQIPLVPLFIAQELPRFQIVELVEIDRHEP